MGDMPDFKIKDFMNGTVKEFIADRIRNSDVVFTDNGEYDEFGTEVEGAADFFTFLTFMYKKYFRVDLHGLGNLPVEGPGLLVSNHAPILPIDGMMIGTGILIEMEKPRLIRAIVNRSISDIPFFSTLMYRTGQVIGCDENVRRVFENGNLVLVFPTGAEGRPHSIFNKYHLDKFTLGFMEYALRHRTPIIPTCVTGSEEAAMTLVGIDLPLAGFKHLPLTPIFPWLGPLGLVPFPSKFDIYFGEPIHYYKDHAGDADNPEKVREIVDDLHDRIKSMLDKALGRES